MDHEELMRADKEWSSVYVDEFIERGRESHKIIGRGFFVLDRESLAEEPPQSSMYMKSPADLTCDPTLPIRDAERMLRDYDPRTEIVVVLTGMGATDVYRVGSQKAKDDELRAR